jgi:glucose/arabinose dehydrogenase
MLKRTIALAAAAAATGLCSTALAGGSFEALDSVRIATGLDYPVFATYAPGDYNRLYILEKRGKIQVLDLTTNTYSLFMNIDARVRGGTSLNDERGLLGLAFHPDFEDNGHFYVYYTEEPSGGTMVERYSTVSPDQGDPTSAVEIISFFQPFSNHNGGWIGFGPDGYLYIGTGDGGSAGDPSRRAQDITNQPHGKMLRIDVNTKTGGGYDIPADNPFVGLEGDDEIWAYGLRNPWRCSFDRETGDLWMADVGQSAWEEVSFQPASSTGGENYGWDCREGAHNFQFVTECFDETFVEPISEYNHSCTGGGFSITGGYVYRGCDIPTLRGIYLFADYQCSNIWTLEYDGKSTTRTNIRSDISPSIDGFTISRIASFGEDLAGNMYIVSQTGSTNGSIFKLIPEVASIEDADVNCDGVIDTADLLIVLASWGPCPNCPADTNGDGTVDTEDLLHVLANWS